MAVVLRLPTQTLFEGRATALTAVSASGSFGLLPNHADLVTSVVPSVLSLRLVDGTEAFFGLDEGILIKKGHMVDVVARLGVRGRDLDSMQVTVSERFLQMDEEERQARAAFSRLEADVVRRFSELRRPTDDPRATETTTARTAPDGAVKARQAGKGDCPPCGPHETGAHAKRAKPAARLWHFRDDRLVGCGAHGGRGVSWRVA